MPFYAIVQSVQKYPRDKIKVALTRTQFCILSCNFIMLDKSEVKNVGILAAHQRSFSRERFFLHFSRAKRDNLFSGRNEFRELERHDRLVHHSFILMQFTIPFKVWEWFLKFWWFLKNASGWAAIRLETNFHNKNIN